MQQHTWEDVVTVPNADPIKHVVLLMFENHSFDQMLGSFKDIYPGLDGVDPAQPGVNRDTAGNEYSQVPTTERQMELDPHHEVDHVRAQLADHNGGFVKDLALSYTTQCTAAQFGYVMGYFPLDFLPALHRVARDFTIGDRWFSSVPGPTWVNRFFALTGTSNGRVNMPDDGTHQQDIPGYFEQDQDTIFDRLGERGVSWKVYFHSIPQTMVLSHQRRPENAARYFPIGQFFADARGREAHFPSFCLIEPDYMAAAENDDHPPHDIMRAQKLIADVYNGLRANADLFESTLLVIVYDEHGGFFDHVVPPLAIPPDEHREEYTFDQYGVRVPAVLVSPWVKRGYDSTLFDHTSVLKYLIEKWNLQPLGHRTATANSIGRLIERFASPREDTVQSITLSPDQLRPPNQKLESQAQNYVSGHHQSLALLVTYLKDETLCDLPAWVATMARNFESIMAFCSRTFGRTSSERDIAGEHAAATAIAHAFVRRRRQKAIPTAVRVLRDANAPLQVRQHAAETLGHVVRMRFHEDSDPVAAAEEWIRRHWLWRRVHLN